jgi:hypothetical protein
LIDAHRIGPIAVPTFLTAGRANADASGTFSAPAALDEPRHSLFR